MNTVTRALAFIAFSESVYAHQGGADSKEAASDGVSVFKVAATALLGVGLIYILFKNRQPALPPVVNRVVPEKPPVDTAPSQPPQPTAPKQGVDPDLAEPEDRKTTLGQKLRKLGHGTVDASATAAESSTNLLVTAGVPLVGGLLAGAVGSLAKKAVGVAGRRGVDATVDASEERWDSFS